jgi:hypothetical protein
MENRVLKRIEVLRRRLNKLGLRRNLIDPKVVEVSQELDGLLNQYQNASKYKQLSFW